jgi:hypothetical protein
MHRSVERLSRSRAMLSRASLLLLLLATLTACRADVVRPVGHIGVDVFAGDRLVAPLRLSTNGALSAGRVGRKGQLVRLAALTCRDPQAVKLSADSFVEVEGQFGSGAKIRFHLGIEAFDAARWQALFPAPAPFHFLSCEMPTAQVWHQRGWLNATPNADPFPLLGDIHAEAPEISCKWNRNWSYVCPMGGSPIPMIGAWDPKARLYVGYDFQEARAGDQSDRYVSGAYCWQLGDAKGFFTLAWPYGGHEYGEQTWPQADDVIDSHCALVVDTDLGPTDDPNERFQQRLFRDYAAALPEVPASNDVGWVGGKVHLRDFPANNAYSIFGDGGEAAFYEPGTLLVNGWGGHLELPVEGLVPRVPPATVEAVRRRLDQLLAEHTDRWEVDGDKCVFWRKPLTGSWRPAWGGAPVTTLHNAEGFEIGRMFLGFWRLDKAAGKANDAYLEAIDGVFHWAEHLVWTRNEFADVPSSPFAIGGTLSASFLLDYWLTFRDDPARRADAALALKLADNITWRYLAVWAMDSDRFDAGLDSSFLAEPNSGRDWAGLACSNEVYWNLDTMCQVYVHTGDARLRYYLRGMLARWPQLYRPVAEESIADCDHQTTTEGLGLFDGSGPGRGERYGFGWQNELNQCEPVGDSKVRVVAGTAACIEFNRGGPAVRVDSYDTDGHGACSFRLAGGPDGDFDVSFSYPSVDVSKLAVVVNRNGADLDWAEHARRPKQAPSSLYLSALRRGDRVSIGTLPPDRIGLDPTKLDAAVLHDPFAAGGAANQGEFRLAAPTGNPLVADWTDTQSFAGLDIGVRWTCGVPYAQELRGASEAVDLKDAPADTREVVVVYAPPVDRLLEAAPTLRLDDGAKLNLSGQPVLGWRAWPPMFKRLVLVDRAALPAGRRAVGIDPGETIVLGHTFAIGRGVMDDARRKTAWAAAVVALREEVGLRARMAALKARFAALPIGPMAVLPPTPGGPGDLILSEAGLNPKLTTISPEQLIDPKVFNAQRFKVAFYMSNEDYVATVRAPGDGAAAYERYLAEGGTMVCLAPGPLPFCYALAGAKKTPDNLLPKLGFPIANAWEVAPDGLTLTNAAPQVLHSLPASLPWPKGDPRLRRVFAASVDKANKYVPLISVRGQDGSDQGDAACAMELGSGPAKGGRIVYVWSTLLTMPQAPELVGDVLAATLEDSLFLR